MAPRRPFQRQARCQWRQVVEENESAATYVSLTASTGVSSAFTGSAASGAGAASSFAGSSAAGTGYEVV